MDSQKIGNKIIGLAPQEVPDLENPPKPPVLEAMFMMGIAMYDVSGD